MTIGTKLYIKFFCEKIGTDRFGNIYYQSKCPKKKRLVYYNGKAEGSKIPPLWNAWLHYTVDEVPENQVHYYNWEKVHIPNLTGTEYAYFPKGIKNCKKTGSYESWTPSS